MAEVSIIIPVYNGAKFITRTLQTVFAQNFDDFEVVVIDDGSKDNTVEVVKDAFRNNKDPRFSTRLIIQRNMGVSVARNSGIEGSSGKYLTFLDADDLLDEDFLCKMYRAIVSSDADIAVCGFDIADESGSVLVSYTDLFNYMNCDSDGPSAALEMLRMSTYVWIANAIYSTDFLRTNSLRFTPGCPYAEEVEFVLRALYNARNCTTVKESLVRYVQRSGAVHETRTSKKLFHSLGARKRLRTLFATTGAPPELIDIMDTRMIPEAYIAALGAILEERLPRRRLRTILSNPVIKKVFIEQSNRPEIKRSIAFLMRNFPLLFLKLWRFRDKLRRKTPRYF